MANQGVGNTALGAAVCRMIEQYQPAATRLFADPVVKNLVGAPLRVMMQIPAMRNFTVQQTDAISAGIFGAQICRTRYIDDVVTATIKKGFQQLVILGAGLDTRPYRLPGLAGVEVFEVDLSSVQDDKKNKLLRHLGHMPEHVTFIPIDFDTQTLDSVFAGSAFDPTRPAVVVWEGVTQYISEQAVQQALAFVGKLAPGSIILFTYVLKSIIEGRSNIPGIDRMMSRVKKNNAPWIFGLEPASLPAYLGLFHLTLVEDVGNTEYQERYLKPLGRELVVSEAERIAQAVVVHS